MQSRTIYQGSRAAPAEACLLGAWRSVCGGECQEQEAKVQ